jgi:hypothetical protein
MTIAYLDLLRYVFKSCFIEMKLDLIINIKRVSKIIRILYVINYFFKIIIKVAISLNYIRDNIKFIYQKPKIIKDYIKPPKLLLKSIIIVKVYS